MDKKIAKLMKAMIEYDHGDGMRIQHLVKVHNFATTIGILESIDADTLFILEAAAVVHDIGIHISEQKYGYSSGKYQEQEGPAEARKLLDLKDFTSEQVERICFLIAHHHSYTNIKGIDYQILLEADFLVNSYEKGISMDSVVSFRNKIFRTVTGKYLLNQMFNIE